MDESKGHTYTKILLSCTDTKHVENLIYIYHPCHNVEGIALVVLFITSTLLLVMIFWCGVDAPNDNPMRYDYVYDFFTLDGYNLQLY